MIEEDEGDDHLPLAVRHRAAHLKTIAEIAGPRHDDQFQRIAGLGIAEYGVVGGMPAHGSSIIVCDEYYSNQAAPSLRRGVRRPSDVAGFVAEALDHDR